MEDDFVPEGRVPLISAVERLARQTNAASAKAEIRTKLHSGSLRAQAMEPSTGRMFDIIPDSWGTEPAQGWLESGTCLLPDEKGRVRITTERFRMSYGPTIATIFILEVELERLIGPASAREGRRPVSDAEATRLFEEWRKGRGDDTPSRKEDVDHMRQFGVSRIRVLALRRGVGVRKRPRGNPRRAKHE
jgi:hypothetical protein